MPSFEVVAQEDRGDGGNSRVPRRLIYAGNDWGSLWLQPRPLTGVWKGEEQACGGSRRCCLKFTILVVRKS